MDLTEILKDVPLGTKLYSPLFTDVVFMGIRVDKDGVYTIDVVLIEDGCETCWICFTHDGRYIQRIKEGECMLFPSKENRDWSTFKYDLPYLTPCICFEEIKNEHPKNIDVCLYAENGKVYYNYYDDDNDITSYSYIIPKDKFKFETLEFNNEDNYGTERNK